MEKTKIYIFDIDGTIALKGERSPFDYTRVSQDTVNLPVAAIYWALISTGAKVVLITGRDESCRPDTEKWLFDNNFPYEALYMRPSGNKELDILIKTSIYRDRIEPYHEVVCVFEDRERVCRMWRQHINLCCLQVADGKF